MRQLADKLSFDLLIEHLWSSMKKSSFCLWTLLQSLVKIYRCPVAEILAFHLSNHSHHMIRASGLAVGSRHAEPFWYPVDVSAHIYLLANLLFAAEMPSVCRTFVYPLHKFSDEHCCECFLIADITAAATFMRYKKKRKQNVLLGQTSLPCWNVLLENAFTCLQEAAFAKSKLTREADFSDVWQRRKKAAATDACISTKVKKEQRNTRMRISISLCDCVHRMQHRIWYGWLTRK